MAANFHDYLRQYLDPLEQHIAEIDKRVVKIEESLGEILKRLSLPPIHEEIEVLSLKEKQFDAKDGPYAYRPLDPSRNEIRILAVHSSLHEDDPIVCELLNAGLEHDASKDPVTQSAVALKEFKTLSYTWGNPENNCSIIIEGHQFPVTKNLEAALKQMRNHQKPHKANGASRPSFWWIDAICINQNDVAERSQQVNLMTWIYKKASGVYIWLGEEDNDSALAMNLIRQLGNSTKRGPGDPDIMYPEIAADQRDTHWKALTALFERPWWERVWIRQEVAVAREATVHCGNETCTFRELSVTADILNKIDEQFGFGPVQEERAEASRSSIADNAITTSPYLQACVLAGFRKDMGENPNVEYRDLADLVVHTRSCKATDLRDKVFSVLGLVDPEFWALRADYRLSINDTLIAAAHCMIATKQSLNILAGCQNPDRLHGLPSWAPNLIDVWRARPFPTRYYGTIGDVSSGEDPDFAFEGEGNSILRAKGYRLDIIDQMSDDTPAQNATAEELDALSTNWKKFAQIVLTNEDVYMFDAGIVEQYQHDDGRWIQFLSATTDSGQPRALTEAPLSTQANYLMLQGLLLPKDHSESTFSANEMRRHIHEHLRKFGVGRRLCITEMGSEKGSVVLVPADAKTGDEIWIFRGTSSQYVLRKVKDEEYVVVGEACEYSIPESPGPGLLIFFYLGSGRYFFLNEGDEEMMENRTIRII